MTEHALVSFCLSFFLARGWGGREGEEAEKVRRRVKTLALFGAP